MAETVHQGRNIKRFREMLGLKQEGLAYELGEDWNQKRVSLLEAKEVVDDALLEQVAKVLKVPAEAFKNFSEEAAINIISNTFQDFKDNAMASTMNYHCTFNPIDKIVELYEALVRTEREKNELLQRIVDERK